VKNYSSNLLNSPLVPVLSPKCTTFSHSVPVQRPLEIEEKNSKKDIFWVFVPVQRPLEIEEKNSKKDIFWVFVPVQIPYF
jgi:hypothetical protein